MINSAATRKIEIYIRNEHYVAKLGRPLTDYVEMSKLDKMKGNDIWKTYLTGKFLNSIADFISARQTF
jgi:hypothetical protein